MEKEKKCKIYYLLKNAKYKRQCISVLETRYTFNFSNDLKLEILNLEKSGYPCRNIYCDGV